MNAFGDDEGSVNGSSDNEQDDQIDELEEPEADPDPEPDPEGEGENEDENEDNDDDDDEQDGSQEPSSDSPSRRQGRAATNTNASGYLSSQRSNSFPTGSHTAPTSNPTVLLTSPSPQRPSPSAIGAGIERQNIRPEALSASVYDIVPTIAAPHSTSINAIAATPDLRWVFSGGTDGYIRKFNWVETANGKVMLTVAQRHPFVDSVTKAGVLTSYWENEEPQSKPGDDGSSLSSVYSLAVHHQGLWLLSGLESGGINLQSVRHDEGKRITCLRKHTSAVSVLSLAQDERSFLSGSWDRNVIDWDLNVGEVKRSFAGSSGQISALEMRPMSSLPVPEAFGEFPLTNGTLSSSNQDKPRVNGDLGINILQGSGSSAPKADVGNPDAPGSPTDSLFGGNDADSLFGDNDEGEPGAPPGGGFPEDDDDEFSRAIANGIQQQENEDPEGDISMIKAGAQNEQPHVNGILSSANGVGESNEDQVASRSKQIDGQSQLTNGLPHAEQVETHQTPKTSAIDTADDIPVADSTFLAASFDGTLRIWDKRKPGPVAKILPRNTPPWCMNACWSPDGNFIYAGRRNGTVEEFSLHKGLRGVERTFKFPNGSGAVSAVRAMPNGRHLICASYDILRLYDLQQQQTFKHSTVPFLIVPGHRTGVVSQLHIDPACRYMISTAGNRGWEGNSTEVLLGYEIGIGP